MKKRNLYIIAGANGSGKTTFARVFLPKYAKCNRFVNPDLIAQGLSPFDPQHVALRAGRLVLEQIHRYMADGLDFAFESTLSGKTYQAVSARLGEEDTAFTSSSSGFRLPRLRLPESPIAWLRAGTTCRNGTCGDASAAR